MKLKMKPEKITLIVVFSLLAVILLVVLIYSGVTQLQQHRHTYTNAYINKTHHARLCVCGAVEMSSMEEHTFIDTKDKDIVATIDNPYGKDYKKCTICGYESYEETHSHMYRGGKCVCGQEENTYVIETEWNNLFVGDQLNNVTLEQVLYTYNDSAPDSPISVTTTRQQLCTPDASFIRTTSDSVYHKKENGVWYGIAYVSNEWAGIIETEREAMAGSFQNTQSQYYVNKYNRFTYNDTKKCFVATNFSVNGEVCQEVSIYIEDGKLIKIEQKVDNGSQFSISVLTFTNYGTTTVAVPDFNIVG